MLKVLGYRAGMKIWARLIFVTTLLGLTGTAYGKDCAEQLRRAMDKLIAGLPPGVRISSYSFGENGQKPPRPVDPRKSEIIAELEKSLSEVRTHPAKISRESENALSVMKSFRPTPSDFTRDMVTGKIVLRDSTVRRVRTSTTAHIKKASDLLSDWYDAEIRQAQRLADELERSDEDARIVLLRLQRIQGDFNGAKENYGRMMDEFRRHFGGYPGPFFFWD